MVVKHGFAKRDRLLSNDDFKLVRKDGMRVASRGMVFAWLAKDRRRLGIKVPSSVGNAAVRNRLRRVIREHFRLNRNLFPVADSVVIARSHLASLDNDEVRSELSNLLSRAGKNG